MALYQQTGFRSGIADCTEGLAGVLAFRGDAAELAEYEQDLKRSRSALDAETFAAAWSLGSVTTLEQAAREVAEFTRPR
jgi:hypothetical protein